MRNVTDTYFNFVTNTICYGKVIELRELLIFETLYNYSYYSTSIESHYWLFILIKLNNLLKRALL